MTVHPKILGGDSAGLAITYEQPSVKLPYMAFSLDHAVNNHAPPVMTLSACYSNWLTELCGATVARQFAAKQLSLLSAHHFISFLISTTFATNCKD